jgi:hypothetical protein
LSYNSKILQEVLRLIINFIFWFFFTNKMESTMNHSRRVLLAAIYKLLLPLVRILLRQGVPCGSFIELAKRAYVEIAEHDFSLSGKKQTDSRISVLTGLTRKEVKLIRENSLHPPDDSAARYNRAARVISGWIQDRCFLDGWGEPMILPLEGEGATFSRLVNSHGGDVPVRAVLDELQRVGTIERLTDGRIKLLQRAYIPNHSLEDKLDILGKDAALLIATIEHNLNCTAQEAYFQRKVSYDNLPEEAIPLLHTLVTQHGQALLEDINHWLSQQDRDRNPAIQGSGRKYAGVGVYFFEENYQQDTMDKCNE